MKLYIEKGNVMFDFSGVDMIAPLNKERDAYENFLRYTQCEWENTELPNMKRMKYDFCDWKSAYGNTTTLRSLIGNCISVAESNGIEVKDSVKKYAADMEAKCIKLRKAEEAKAEALAAKDKWERLCKTGCGRCENKKRCGDDFKCVVSGDYLEEMNVPRYDYGTYYPFNLEAFPSENCPYNINKKQGENNDGTERVSEACASAATA